ncbi:hypothetical protein E6O75_ATG00170 [Venturia nashicola]|uniref:Uncharacterized protein n=1 Tax=Venturia nashicola TaxID=86259 RepID=A0A4Z1PEN2_9PEZI|nr:hypothetical protein E6O75_ATG00170 [Venturia nashicola]
MQFSSITAVLLNLVLLQGVAAQSCQRPSNAVKLKSCAEHRLYAPNPLDNCTNCVKPPQPPPNMAVCDDTGMLYCFRDGGVPQRKKPT